MGANFIGPSGTMPAKPDGKTGSKAKFLGAPRKEELYTPEQLAEKEWVDSLNAARAKEPWADRTVGAIDDLMRKFAEGASYGGLDRMLGEEDIQKTKEASARSGSLGTAAEVAGAIASPITRLIGAGAKAASSPVTNKLLNATLRGGLEGGASGGAYAGISDTGSVPEDAAWSAAIGSNVPVLLKMLGLGGKTMAGMLAGVEPKHYTTAFNLGKQSPEAAKALKSAMQSEAPTALDDAVNKGRISFANTPVGPNDESIGATITEIMNKRMSNSGIYAGTSADKSALEAVLGSTMDARGNNLLKSVEDILAFRQSLGEYGRKPQFNIGADTQDIIKAVDVTGKKAGGKAYEKVAKDMDTLNEARTAGAALRSANPSIINSPGLLATALAGATGIGLAGVPVTAPMLAGAVATLLASSPKFTGAAARKAGTAARRANEVLPMTSGRVGLAELVSKDKEKRRRNRGQQ